MNVGDGENGRIGDIVIRGFAVFKYSICSSEFVVGVVVVVFVVVVLVVSMFGNGLGWCGVVSNCRWYGWGDCE